MRRTKEIASPSHKTQRRPSQMTSTIIKDVGAPFRIKSIMSLFRAEFAKIQ